MIDDAMRKAYDRWKKSPANRDWNHMTWPAFCGGAEYKKTALLEKLKSEEAINAAVTNLREMDNWLTKDAEGDTIENYEAIARAVIEALEKEMVG